MRIGILAFGFEQIDSIQQPQTDDNFFERFEGISGDALLALYLAKNFKQAGHDCQVAHYKQASEISQQVDLILTIGEGGTRQQYQNFGETPALYWWMSLGGYQDQHGDFNYYHDKLEKSAYDGIIAAGRQASHMVGNSKPSLYLPIGTDPELFTPTETREEYKHELVYLGFANYKHPKLVQELFSVAGNYDFAIYGHGWEDTPYQEFHQGQLPLKDIPELYSSSKIVLGLHQDMIKMGVVNTRVFEALATESVFVEKRYPALEEFEPFVNLYEDKQSLNQLLESIFSDYDRYQNQAKAGRQYVKHNYDLRSRVKKIIQFARTEIL